MSRYRVDSVVGVTVQGSCCWHVFPHAFRRGTPTKLGLGYSGNDQGRFRSLVKTAC